MRMISHILTAVVLSVSSFSVVAASTNEYLNSPFVEARYGASHVDGFSSERPETLAVFAGSNITDRIGFELGYITSETADFTITHLGDRVRSFVQYDAIAGHLIVDSNPDPGFGLIGHAGVAYVDITMSSQMDSEPPVHSDSAETGLSYGAGVRYEFGNGFRLTAQFSQMPNVDFGSIGLRYSF